MQNLTISKELLKEICDTLLDAEATIATTWIGRDHGVTPQAIAAMKESQPRLDSMRNKLIDILRDNQ